MTNTYKAEIKKNRKTALILGFSTMLILQIIIFIIIKAIQDPSEQLWALFLASTILVILLIIYGKYRKKEKRKLS